MVWTVECEYGTIGFWFAVSCCKHSEQREIAQMGSAVKAFDSQTSLIKTGLVIPLGRQLTPVGNVQAYTVVLACRSPFDYRCGIILPTSDPVGENAAETRSLLEFDERGVIVNPLDENWAIIPLCEGDEPHDSFWNQLEAALARESKEDPLSQYTAVRAIQRPGVH